MKPYSKSSHPEDFSKQASLCAIIWSSCKDRHPALRLLNEDIVRSLGKADIACKINKNIKSSVACALAPKGGLR